MSTFSIKTSPSDRVHNVYEVRHHFRVLLLNKMCFCCAIHDEYIRCYIQWWNRISRATNVVCREKRNVFSNELTRHCDVSLNRFQAYIIESERKRKRERISHFFLNDNKTPIAYVHNNHGCHLLYTMCVRMWDCLSFALYFIWSCWYWHCVGALALVLSPVFTFSAYIFRANCCWWFCQRCCFCLWC